MSIPEKVQGETVQPTRIQLTQARMLGLDTQNWSDTAALVQAVDNHLGKQAIERQAYWYVLSVWRDLHNGQWSVPEDSGLDDATMASVLHEFLGRRETRLSLTRVLADCRYRYNLVSFATRRDTHQLLLTRTTKAYRFAVAALAGLPPRAVSASLIAGDDVEDNDHPEFGLPGSNNAESIVDRRAGRRARELSSAVVSVANSVNNMQAQATTNLARPVAELSDEEYNELQEVLQDNEGEAGTVSPQKSIGKPGERISLVLGLIAGLLFYATVSWLFF